MAQGLGDAYVNIIPKAKDITSNMEKVLGGAGGQAGAEKAGAGLGKKLLGGLAKLGIGAAIGSTIKGAFDVGGKLQQSFGGLETIYGEAANAAKYFAQTSAEMGISANDYAEQAVSFGAALKAAYKGDTFAAMEAADQAIKDMADNAAKMGTPLESLQNAYQGFAKGNYTMLDNLKLGYGGTQEEMQRLLKDAEKISGVKYDMKNLGDVYSAIHVIQGELGLTGVAAGEAKTTLTGSAGAMKASWENLMGAMATGEGMDIAMRNLTDSVGSFVGNVLKMVGNIGPQLPDLIMGLADVVIDNAPAFIGAGAELIVKLIVGLVERIPDVAAKVPEIWASFKSAFAGINWGQLGADLMTAIGNAIVAADEWLRKKTAEAIAKVGDAVSSVDWAGLGKNIIDGIVSGLSAWAHRLGDKLRSIVRGGVNEAKQEAEISSPSKLFAREVGRWIPEGIAMGAEDNTAPLDKAMRNIVASAVIDVPQAQPAAGSFAGSDADRIIAALRELELRADVSLQGDARGLFRVVQQQNTTRTRATGYNALAPAMGR